MNILIVGFGVAGRHYFNILKNNKNVKKIYIHNDKKLIKDKKYIQVDFDLKYFKKKKIKYAIISTPSNLHYKYSKLLLKSSINILIEKPFVLKLKHAQELIKISKKKRTKCWVAFQNRCNLAIQKAKKILDKKLIGKLFIVDCSLFWNRSKEYYKISWRGRYKSDGGVLANQAIHLLDAVVYLLGKIKKFNGIIKFNKSKLQAEDLISLNFEHKNGIITSFKATTRADSNYRAALDILGESGRILVKGISMNTLQILTNNQLKVDKKNSENFETGSGSVGAMGNGHFKILKEFLNNKTHKSKYDLEISKNFHSLEIIHSVYNASTKKNFFTKIENKQSMLGI